MKSIATLLVCLGFSLQSFAAIGAQEAVLFKKAENSIIDLLRIENPYLDSRNVKIEYHETGGVSFGICCFTTQLLVASDTEENLKLGSFEVTVGNGNYVEYQKGIMHTTITMKNKATVLPDFQCKFTAEKIAKNLFNKNITIKDRNPSTEPAYYASYYTFNVLSDEKILGSIQINAADCELASVSIKN